MKIALSFKLYLVFLLTPQTAACSMASNPPSGASKLPDILSFWSSLLKKSRLLVSLMTFLKENGGSLLGHGWASLRERKKDGQCKCTLFCTTVCTYVLNGLEDIYITIFLLLWGSHVSLGLDHFVHKLSKANGIAVWQILHQWRYRKYIHYQYYSDNLLNSHHNALPMQSCSPSSFPILFKLFKSSAMELEKSIRM